MESSPAFIDGAGRFDGAADGCCLWLSRSDRPFEPSCGVWLGDGLGGTVHLSGAWFQLAFLSLDRLDSHGSTAVSLPGGGYVSPVRVVYSQGSLCDPVDQ